jgi:hypothetical protein
MIRIRPSLRRFLRFAVPIVVLVGAWQVWTNIEMRRLTHVMEQFGTDDRRHPTGAEGEAARFYAAAAIASANLQSSAVPSNSPLDVIRRRRESLAADQPAPAEDAEAWSDVLQRAALPVSLLQRGAELPFRGWAPGTDFNYRASGILNASRLSEAPTLEAIASGDSALVFSTLFSRIQFLRALDREGAFLQGQNKARLMQDVATDMAIAMGTGTLASQQLQRLDQALEPIERDGELQEVVKGLAFTEFDFASAVTRGRSWQYGILGIAAPWLVHGLVTDLEALARAFDIARRPWPERYRATATIPNPSRSYNLSGTVQNIAMAVASSAASIRSLRVAVAAHTYRDAHGAWPMTIQQVGLPAANLADPFTGSPLRYRVSGDELAIYSVGPDGRDDGAHFAPESIKGRAPGVGPLLDVGIRVNARRVDPR